MAISDKEIASHASRAGFSKEELPVAVAVALAESGGRVDAIKNEPDGSTSFGLMQINSVHKDLLAIGEWKDPATNMRMAHSLFVARNRSWKDWSAFNNKTYLLFLPRGAAAAAVVEAGNVVEEINPIDDIKQTLSDITRGFKFVTDPHNWFRLGLILFGGLLLGLMTMQMIRGSRLANATAKAVKAIR